MAPAARVLEFDTRAGPLALVAALAQIPPIYLVAAAMVAGDGLGNLRICVPLWMASLAALAGAGLFMISRPSLGALAVLVGIGSAATVPAHQLVEPASGPAGIRRFPDGARLTIEGHLLREAEPYHGRIHLYVNLDRAGKPLTDLRPARGMVRVTVLGPAVFRVGEQVRITSKLRFPRNYGNPGEFDYEAFEAREGITATMVVPGAAGNADSSIDVIAYHARFWASSVEAIRRRIGAFIDANLDYPVRAEMRALVLGDQGEIGEELRNDFALTGMAHLLVISGLHLSFVAAAAFGAVRFLAAFFPSLLIRGYANKLAAVSAALAVAAYASIVGHRVSTVRALVMVLAYLFAVVIDRARAVLASLALAALVICFVWPGSTADIGFQLSFASVLAIVLGMRRLAAWWDRRRAIPAAPGLSQPAGSRVAEFVAGYLAVSFWALLGTAPLTAYHFNQFAIVGLVANAIVVPLMGAAGTVLGLTAIAISFISAPAARAVLWSAGELLAAGTWLARWFVRLPLAWTRTFTPTIAELVLAYGFLLMWLCSPVAATESDVIPGPNVSPPRRPHWRFGLLGVLIAALAADAAWWVRDRYFNPDLRVAFLSVGQGDCAVVRFPGGRVMLIDGGGQLGEFDPGERIIAPFLWSRKIMHVDYVVLSHPELDHFGGLDFIVRNFNPGQFWTISTPSPDIKYLDLLGRLTELGARLQIVDSSFSPPAIGGVRIRCLWPRPGELENRNNSSMVLRLGFGPTSIMFTGDLEARGEHLLMERETDLGSTVLKVPHHGSATSSTQAFVESVRPRVAVISAGYRNRFGFPDGEVVGRYASVGAKVLRTDEDGAIEIDASREAIGLVSGRTDHRGR